MIRTTSLARLREQTYTIPKGSTEIALTCGHTAIYVRPAPAPGTDAFCRTCGMWRRRKRESKNTTGLARKLRRPAGSRLRGQCLKRGARWRGFDSPSGHGSTGGGVASRAWATTLVTQRQSAKRTGPGGGERRSSGAQVRILPRARGAERVKPLQ